MSKLPTLVKAFLGEKIRVDSNENAQPTITGADGISDVPPVSSTAAFEGVGGSVNQRSGTTSSGDPVSGVQAVGAVTVGAAAGGLMQSGALGDSDSTKETIKAVGQEILQNYGISSRTANDIVEAASGNKNAQVDLGIQAVSALSKGFITEDAGRTVVGALEGDKAAQQKLVLKAVDVLSNNPTAAPVIKAAGELGQKAIDTILPRGSPLRGVVSDFLGKEYNKLANNAPLDNAPPRIAASTGVSRLQKLRQRRDPLLNFDWKVELPDIGNAGVNVTGDTFNFYAEEVTIALPYYQSNDVFRCGSRKNYPGFSDVGSITVTLYEDNQMTASAYLNHWHSLIQNKAGAYYNLPSVYKKTFYVYCYDVKGNTVGLFKVTDAWPLQRGNYSLQSSSSDRVILSAEFATDGIFFQRVENGAPVEQAVPVSSLAKADYSGKISSMLQSVGLSSKIAGPVSKVANSFIPT